MSLLKSLKINNYSQDLFIKLHQQQVDLLKNPVKSSINSYHSELIALFTSETPLNGNITSSDSNNLVEFLAFPVLSALKKVQSSADSRDLSELLLSSLSLILDNVQLSNISLFEDILNSCSLTLSRHKTQVCIQNN